MTLNCSNFSLVRACFHPQVMRQWGSDHLSDFCKRKTVPLSFQRKLAARFGLQAWKFEKDNLFLQIKRVLTKQLSLATSNNTSYLLWSWWRFLRELWNSAVHFQNHFSNHSMFQMQSKYPDPHTCIVLNDNLLRTNFLESNLHCLFSSHLLIVTQFVISFKSKAPDILTVFRIFEPFSNICCPALWPTENIHAASTASTGKTSRTKETTPLAVRQMLQPVCDQEALTGSKIYHQSSSVSTDSFNKENGH